MTKTKNKTDRNITILFYFLLLLIAADAVSTLIGLNYLSLKETNPITLIFVRKAGTTYGILFAFMLKSLLAVSVYSVFRGFFKKILPSNLDFAADLCVIVIFLFGIISCLNTVINNLILMIL